jgi:hypothetical protein
MTHGRQYNGENAMALNKKQLDTLTQILLEDDTDSDDVLEYNDAFRGIIYNFEDELDLTLDADDRKALFANCMKTFTDRELSAAFPLGFVRGLKDALEITETFTITI